jgi:hypothetical protein
MAGRNRIAKARKSENTKEKAKDSRRLAPVWRAQRILFRDFVFSRFRDLLTSPIKTVRAAFLSQADPF